MESSSPLAGDVISFTHQRYPNRFLVGTVTDVRQATAELDVEACLSAPLDGSTLVTFAPSGGLSSSTSLQDLAPTPAQPAVDLQKELEELRERRDVLHDDIVASHARVRALDEEINAVQIGIKTATTAATTAAKATPEATPDVVKADKGLTEARKGLQASLKTAIADWTKLKTVGATPRPSATNTEGTTTKILKGPPPPKEAVELVEAALAILGSKSAGTTFRAAQSKLTESMKKCSMLKPEFVKSEQLKRAEACLARYTSATLAKKTAPAALVPLYTWIKAITGSVTARQQAASEPRKSASPDPVKPPEGSEEALQMRLAQLTQERREHVDYIDLGDEELDAMDALLRETEAAVSAATSPSRMAQQTRAMHVPLSQVVAVLPNEDRTRLAVEKAVLMPPGASLALPRETMRIITGQASAAAAAAPSSDLAATPTTPPQQKQPIQQEQPQQKKSSARVLFDLPPEDQHAPPAKTHPSPTSSPRSRGVSLWGMPETPTAPAAGPLSDDERARLNARIDALEHNLNLALHRNPTQAEVQLLREELTAKSADLERLTHERDTLLQEKRERPRRSSMLMPRARPDYEREHSSADPAREAEHDGEDGGLDATIRPRVDRRVAEELEEQLNAAHQRIRQLEKQLSTDSPTAGAGTAANGNGPAAMRRASDKTQGEASSSQPQAFSPVGMLSRTLPVKTSHTTVGESEAMSLQSVASGDEDVPSHAGDDDDGTAQRQTPDNSFSHVPPPLRTSASFVSPDVQQQFEARLSALQQELEQQKKQTMMAEDRLNLALHAQQEAQQVSESQKKELKTLWKRLEDAEALLERARFQAALVARRQSIMDESSYVSVSPSLPNVMPMEELSGANGGTLSASKGNTPLARANNNPNNNNNNTGGAGNASVMSIHEAGSGLLDNRSSPSLEVPADDPLRPSPSMTNFSAGPDYSGRRFSAPPGRVMSVGRRDSRSMSLAGPVLSNAPVEQMTPVELRHEVRALRAEVERLQSSERRLSTELAEMQARQKEERRQRREARRARMNMMATMEKAVAAALAPQEPTDVQDLLSLARSDAESIRSRHTSSRDFSM